MQGYFYLTSCGEFSECIPAEPEQRVTGCVYGSLPSGKKTDILKKYKEEFHVSDEAFKSMSDQWNSVLKSEDILKKQSEAEHLIKDAQGQLEENKPLMEQIRNGQKRIKKVVDYKG